MSIDGRHFPAYVSIIVSKRRAVAVTLSEPCIILGSRCRRLRGADLDPSAQVPHRQQDASLFATSRPGIVKRADQDGGMLDTARFFDDVDQGLRRDAGRLLSGQM